MPTDTMEIEEQGMKFRQYRYGRWRWLYFFRGVFVAAAIGLAIALGVVLTQKDDNRPVMVTAAPEFAETSQKMEVAEQQEGCRGANSKYVKLVTGDGHIFYLERKFVLLSKTMTTMLSGPFEAQNDNESEIQLKDMNSMVMKKVCEYLIYKSCYTCSEVLIPEFPMDEKLVLELLLAADFLDC